MYLRTKFQLSSIILTSIRHGDNYTPLIPQNESLTLSRMGIFGAAHWWGSQKGPSLPKICHTNPTIMKLGTVLPYVKKIQKIHKSRDIPPEFCWNQHFFTGNQQIVLYQEIKIQIAFWYIISNSFNFSWVFNGFFNKPRYNFDDISKKGYPRPS